jgi:predicted dienelactone hydrolase
MIAVLLLGCQGGGDDTAPAEVAWADPDTAGPYAVGATTLEFTDSRGKELTVEVWYPAIQPASGEPDPYELPVARAAYREADPAVGGPFPLLAFSHGFGGIRYQSIFLTEHLASHGFVVVSPDHTHNTFLDLDEDFTPQVLFERPDDIRHSVDEVLRLSEAGDEIFGGMLDPDAGYGMMGHSFGGFTTLVVAGGELSYEGVLTYCKDNNARACGYIDEIDPAMAEGHGQGDDRVLAAVPMSPGLWYAFGDEGEGLSGLDDLLVLGGDQDQVLDYSDEILPVYEALGTPRTLATFTDAGHYAFADICDIIPLFDDCAEEEEGWINLDQAHLITQTIVTAHFGVHVAGDERYAPWLEADALSVYPELIWTHEE